MAKEAYAQVTYDLMIANRFYEREQDVSCEAQK